MLAVASVDPQNQTLSDLIMVDLAPISNVLTYPSEAGPSAPNDTIPEANLSFLEL